MLHCNPITFTAILLDTKYLKATIWHQSTLIRVKKKKEMIQLTYVSGMICAGDLNSAIWTLTTWSHMLLTVFHLVNIYLKLGNR